MMEITAVLLRTVAEEAVVIALRSTSVRHVRRGEASLVDDVHAMDVHAIDASEGTETPPTTGSGSNDHRYV